MSVAVGMAQPGQHVTRAAAQTTATATKNRAGTATPQTAAAIGSAALRRVGQVAGHELALELDPGDEEEDREQAVGRPRPEGEVEVQRVRADDGVAQRGVGVRARGCWPRRAP